MTCIRSFIEKLKTTIYFIPVIWNVKWWDYSSLLQLQLAQLSLMEKNWVTHSYHVNAKRSLRDISKARILTQRILKDEYTCASWKIKQGTSIFNNEQFDYVPGEIEDKQKQQDLDVLCKIIRKKLFTWWD